MPTSFMWPGLSSPKRIARAPLVKVGDADLEAGTEPIVGGKCAQPFHGAFGDLAGLN